MAQVGYMGDVVFVASEKELRTPANLTRSSSARWTDHNLHLRKPIGEFAGADLEQIQFKIALSAMHGVNPEDEIKTLRQMMDNGEVFPLVLGGAPLSENYWRIESLSVDNTYYDGKGELIFAELSVSLKEYDDSRKRR